MINQLSFFCLAFLLLSSCEFNFLKSNKKCLVETFAPIFPNDLNGVERHQFEKNKEGSSERFTLSTLLKIPINVEILQYGCQNFTQELRFEFMDEADPIPRNFQAKDCAGLMTGLFFNIGKMHPELLTFNQFGEVMAQKINNFEYNSPVVLQDGFSMQLDKLHQNSSTLITVIIKQSAE